MAWFRVDDLFPYHPKVLSIPRKHRRDALGLWYRAGNWCAGPGKARAGHVPRFMIDELEYTLEDASALATAGLWEPADDGWLFHDWEVYQPSQDDAMAKLMAKQDAISKRRSAIGRLGAAARWGTSSVPNDAQSEGQDGWQTDDVCADQDGKPMANDGNAMMANDGKMANDALPDPTRPVPSELPKEGRAKRATRISDSFGISDAMRGWASENVPGMDIDYATKKFVLHFQAASGQRSTMVNWGAAWKKWMLGDYKPQPNGQQPKRGYGLPGERRSLV